MLDLIPYPGVRTLVLSAGPRAGKTRHLNAWFATLPSPTHHMALTPEDVEVNFFRYRFFSAWPVLRTRYEALTSVLPKASWGGRLGLAIAELSPDFCLIIDDFHLCEGTELETELLALFRHFPATGTLILSSRHQIPAIARESVLTWGPDEPLWHEQPAIADVHVLPIELQAKAFSLLLLGGTEPSSESRELVRRNIARQEINALHRLRPEWRLVVEQAMSHAVPSQAWTQIETDLKSLAGRYYRTCKEQELLRVEESVPSYVRRQSSFFLRMEGERHLENQQYREAQECFTRALALSSAEDDHDLRIRLLEVAIRLKDSGSSAELFEQLNTRSERLLPHQETQLAYLDGLRHWCSGENDEARRCWEHVLIIPAFGDRRAHYQHYLAMRGLHEQSILVQDYNQARNLVDRMVDFSSEHGFQCDLLDGFSARLQCQLADEARILPLSEALSVPIEAFRSSCAVKLFEYIYQLLVRFYHCSDLELALRLNDWATSKFNARNLEHLVNLNYYWRMILLGRMGQLEKAGEIHARLLDARTERLKSLLPLAWARILIQSERHTEAATILRDFSDRFSDVQRTHAQILLQWIRHREGSETALTTIRDLLQTKDGQQLWASEARLMHAIGLRSLPPCFRVKVFGELSFTRDGEAAERWPRRKALSLLGQLALQPEGLPSEHLASKLFPSIDPLDQNNSLHAVSHSLRQVLKSVAAIDLIDTSRGYYRLRWRDVAFCDLHEFDQLHAKAGELEAGGMLEAATLLYDMAAVIPDGALFANLPDDFEEERAIYRDKLRRVRELLERSAK